MNITVADFFLPIKGQSGSQFARKNEFIQTAKTLNLKRGRTYENKVELKAIFYFYGNYKNIKGNYADLDNMLKSLCDYLQSYGYIKNDSQIKKINAEIKENSLFEGISIIINKYV